MGGLGAIIGGILSLFLLLGPFQPPITDGIHNWRTNDTTEAFTVTDLSGVSSANVTLAHDLYQAATGEVISIASDNVTEAPVVASYTESTKKLYFDGLQSADNSRIITVRYYAETDDTVMRALGPFLSVLIFGGSAFAILFVMYSSLKHKGRR